MECRWLGSPSPGNRGLVAKRASLRKPTHMPTSQADLWRTRVPKARATTHNPSAARRRCYRGVQQSRPARHRSARHAVADGIVINGLPILALEPWLEQYYVSDGIGGPGVLPNPTRPPPKRSSRSLSQRSPFWRRRDVSIGADCHPDKDNPRCGFGA